MTTCDDNLLDAMAALSANNDNNCLKELKLDDSAQAKLRQIEKNFESIFSWDIKGLTGIRQNLILNLIDKIQDKCKLIMVKDDVFNLNRFFLQLIISYELYNSKHYKESLMEIENVVKSLESCTFDEPNIHYSDAYYHIARATNAYIAISLNFDSEKIMKDIKSTKSLNRAEKAAICAVKARVFMEYPPKGNDIALKFAEQACSLHCTEPEWIIIRLKAKGRVRRFYDKFKMPEKEEMDSAEMLCTTKTDCRLLIQASLIFVEAASGFKFNGNFKESNKYYSLSSDLILKAIELAKDNVKELYCCLKICIDHPKKFLSKPALEQLIQTLAPIKNSEIDQVLGSYYLKHERDYEKAKMYLSRGMAAGDFNCSLKLIKVECLLQPIEKFPVVKSLVMIYDVFPSPKRRLIVLSQILIYYYFYEYKQKELMHYLKLYMDQEIDDTLKKQHLIFAYPMFMNCNNFKNKQFFVTLLTEIKKVMNNLDHHEWSNKEKEIAKDTCDRFNKLSTLKIYEDQNHCNNKQNEGYYLDMKNQNKTYKHYNVRQNDNWRKQQVNPSEKNFNFNNHKYSSTSKNIHQKDTCKNKNSISNKEPPAYTNDKIVADFKVSTSKLHVSYDLKQKKFENQYTSLENLHTVSIEKNSTLERTDGYRGRGRGSGRGRGRGEYKPSWRNQQNNSKNQNVQSFKNADHNHKNVQFTQRSKNVNSQSENLKNENKFSHCSVSSSNSNPN